MADLYNPKSVALWTDVSEVVEPEKKEEPEQPCLAEAVASHNNEVEICLWTVVIICCLRFWQTLILRRVFSEYPGKIRPPCTTMPWTIWPALVVLWGVCWMFHWPNTAESVSPKVHASVTFGGIQDYGDHRTHPVLHDGLDIENSYRIIAEDTWFGNSRIFQFTFPDDNQAISYESADPRLLDGFDEPDVLSDRLSEVTWGSSETAGFTNYETLFPPAISPSHLESSPSAPSESTSTRQRSPSTPLSLTPGKAFLCPHCPQSSFTSQGLLNRHNKRKHSRPYQCNAPGCAWRFASKSDLNRHRRSVHKEDAHEEDVVFFCPHAGCKRSRDKSEGGAGGFPRRDKLEDHVKRKHRSVGMDKPPIKPPQAGVAHPGFASEQMDHQQLHVTEPGGPPMEIVDLDLLESGAGMASNSRHQPSPNDQSDSHHSQEEEIRGLLDIIEQQSRYIRALENGLRKG